MDVLFAVVEGFVEVLCWFPSVVCNRDGDISLRRIVALFVTLGVIAAVVVAATR